MIKIKIYRNQSGEICGFKAQNHGASIVCAAVSILTINTINCIEKFTGEKMLCKHDDGGFIECSFPNIKKGTHNHDVNLLLNTMLFGLANICHEHAEDIHIFDKEVSLC